MVESKVKLIQRLRRIEGQIRGLQRMIESGRNCEEIITQFASINGALKGAGFLIVKFYINDCVTKSQGTVANMEKDIEKVLKTYISAV